MGSQQTGRPPAVAAPAPSRRRRWGARLRSRAAEDGVFRPVRLPLWVDLAIAAAMLAAASGAFVGFFVWLARTQ
jgi:hypothetical protein